MNIRDLKNKLNSLKWSVDYAPEVLAARKLVLERRNKEINEIEDQIKKLKEKQPKKKTRFPENTPDNVLKACENYWQGTEEFWKFRIHVWNDKAVWTSWGAGGYSTNGGWVKVKPCYFLISLTEMQSDCGRNRNKKLRTIDCDDRQDKKVTKKELQEILDELPR
jgi:hypothetical protein